MKEIVTAIEALEKELQININLRNKHYRKEVKLIAAHSTRVEVTSGPDRNNWYDEWHCEEAKAEAAYHRKHANIVSQDINKVRAVLKALKTFNDNY